MKTGGTSIGEEGADHYGLFIHPNPVVIGGSIILRTDGLSLNDSEVLLIDMTGRQVARSPASPTISVIGIAAGMYTLRLVDGNGQFVMRSVMVR